MDGPDNMALDVALMLRARRTGETVLRIYGWSPPTLSFGRNQRVRDAVDPAALAASGLGVVRRPTGGRTLLHHREITYSVTAPVEASMRESYARINDILMNALARLEVPAVAAGPASARSLPPSAAPCFAEPATGELVVDGRKLVGSAQWRDGGALLQHGSILLDDDQPGIATVMRSPPPRVPPAATLRALLGRAPSSEEMGDRLRDAVRTLADPAADWFDPEPWLLAEATGLAAGYRDDRWTWRR
jgi:lipoyl(octanoyl) transferase